MKRLEFSEDLNELLIAALQGLQSRIYTAVPAIVQSFNASENTLVAQPAIQAQLTDAAGNQSWVNLPQCLDVPVLWNGGGGFTSTFPIAAGDEALLLFSARCIDAWWQSGAIGPQAELRMHNLSDGFALVGLRSLPRALGAVSTTAAQLRSDDGETYVEVGPGKIQLVADEVVIHGRNKATFDAGGTGFVYTPALIDEYTNGVATVGHPPTPPEVPT